MSTSKFNFNNLLDLNQKGQLETSFVFLLLLQTTLSKLKMNPLQTNDYSTSLPNSSSSVSYHPYSSLSPNNFNNRFEQPQTTNNYQLTGLPYSFTPYIVSASHNNHYSSPLNYIYPPFLPPAQIDFQRSVSQVYEPPSSLLPAMASSRRSREEVEEENEVVGIEELKKIRKKRRLSSEEPSVEDKKSRIYVCSICEKSFAR